MFNDDISEAPPSYTPCSAVRITPYADDGEADHDQAVTYRFETPITFAYTYRTRLPFLGTTLGRDEQPMPGLVGFTVPRDHEEADTVCAVAQGLWQRRGTYVAVDLWSRGPGGWLYVLIPMWRGLDLNEHPGLAKHPGHRVLALGESLAVSRPSRWPRLTLGAYDVELGTQQLLSTDTDPPPPAGFPAPTMAVGQRTAP